MGIAFFYALEEILATSSLSAVQLYIEGLFRTLEAYYGTPVRISTSWQSCFPATAPVGFVGYFMAHSSASGDALASVTNPGPQRHWSEG